MGSNPSPLNRLREWWLALPLGRRVNVALYGLSGIAVLFLVAALLGDRGDDSGQVAAGGTTTTDPPASTTSTRPTTTLAAPSTAPTSTTPTTAAGGTATTVRTTVTTARSNPTNPPPNPTSPSTTALQCANSSNPACGEFRWEPPPGPNQTLRVTLRPFPASAVVGQSVAFGARVEDPDHLVDSTCATIDFGDGSPPWQAPCPHPPACPVHYGPWAPPAPEPGVFEPGELARHTYTAPGTYQVKATFYSMSQTRCPDLDPYASAGTGSVTLIVTQPTTTTTLPPPTSTSTSTTSTTAPSA